LRDFLDQQIAEFRQRYPEAVDSGLLLDILAFHTTPLGTADERSVEELTQQYAHMADVLPPLVQQCQDLHLLTVAASAQKESVKTTRLAHDTLAPLVREQFDQSDKPGQRARRILDSRSVDWKVAVNLMEQAEAEFSAKRYPEGLAGLWKTYHTADTADPFQACLLQMMGAWESSVGQPLVHDAPIRFIGFSRDGKRVVTSASPATDSKTRAWLLPLGEPNDQPPLDANAVDIDVQLDALHDKFAVYSTDWTRTGYPAEKGIAIFVGIAGNVVLFDMSNREEPRLLQAVKDVGHEVVMGSRLRRPAQEGASFSEPGNRSGIIGFRWAGSRKRFARDATALPN
jgi:hypothetical protein